MEESLEAVWVHSPEGQEADVLTARFGPFFSILDVALLTETATAGQWAGGGLKGGAQAVVDVAAVSLWRCRRLDAGEIPGDLLFRRPTMAELSGAQDFLSDLFGELGVFDQILASFFFALTQLQIAVAEPCAASNDNLEISRQV